MIEIDFSKIPKSPGVYIWKDKVENVLYVGKAKSLQHRMKQYFVGMANSYKTAQLVENIKNYEYIITNNEQEALILERNLIEKYAPKYNILLLDDKRFPYIKISLTNTLNIQIVYRIRSQNTKTAQFYGPFPHGFGARRMANLITRITKYKDGLPNRETKLEFWEKQYQIATKLLSMDVKSLIKDLKEKMNQASIEMKYEIAYDLKESINGLSSLIESQKVEFINQGQFDVIGTVEYQNYIAVVMFFYRQGVLLSKKEYIVEIVSNFEQTYRNFINQYYKNAIIPKNIYTNVEVETNLKITIPQKGKFRKVVDLARQNASDNIKQKLEEFIRKEELTLNALKELSDLIEIPKIHTIEMIDNSNTSNTFPVSTIIRYDDGIPQRHYYRKYSLETNQKLADTDYMAQGLTKHFKNKTAFPDLLIVDGGIAQVNVAKKIVSNLKIIGLVKNDKHLTRAIINQDGKEIEISSQNLLNFLQKMQTEVDRYAKSYHFKKRQSTLEGKLKTISGIGPKLESKLITHFKSYATIYNATIEELEKVVPPKLAQKIKKEFNE